MSTKAYDRWSQQLAKARTQRALDAVVAALHRAHPGDPDAADLAEAALTNGSRLPR